MQHTKGHFEFVGPPGKDRPLTTIHGGERESLADVLGRFESPAHILDAGK